MPERLLKGVAKKAFFKDKNFVLYKDDCINFLRQLPENSIDMIFADPPYNLSNGGFTVHAGKRVSVDKGEWDVSKGADQDFEFHTQWINECRRILKKEGSIWISGTYHSIYQCGFALQLLGYKILNEIAWYKPNASPNLSGRYFTASHETLIWALKDPKFKHTYNYQDMKNGNWHEKDKLKNEGKQMRSVWSINTPHPYEKKFGKHPTQKPIALLKRIILSSTRPNDVVLDPFTGSSTTGLSAVALGRQFIGIDLEKDFLDLSVKRYKDQINQEKLL